MHAALVNFIFPYVDVVYSGYLLTYQLFMSPVLVAGYAQELFGARRRW